MKLLPLGSRVLIKRKDITQVGSILIVKGSQEMQASLGEVIAVGPECEFLREGDVVTFGRYAPLKILKDELDLYGMEVQFDKDTTYLLMNEADVLCIIAESMPPRSEEEVA